MKRWAPITFLWERIGFLLSLTWRPWSKGVKRVVWILGAFLVVLRAVDLTFQDFLTGYVQEEFPRFYGVVTFLDPFAWVSIVLFALLVTVLDRAYRRVKAAEQSDANRPSKFTKQLLAFVEEGQRLSEEFASSVVSDDVWGQVSGPEDARRNWERRVQEYLREHDSTLYLRFRTPDRARCTVLVSQYRSEMGQDNINAWTRADLDTSMEKLRRIMEDSDLTKSLQISAPDGFVFIRRAVQRLLELRKKEMIGGGLEVSLACDALVSAALEDHVCIWGRRKYSANFEPIESSFWNIGSIDAKDIMADDGSLGKTYQRTYATGYRTYVDLCIDYESLDHVWPEHRKKSGG